MGLKKAFDDAEKRGETRCSVCLSAVHSKEYHENAARQQAGVSAVARLVAKWVYESDLRTRQGKLGDAMLADCAIELEAAIQQDAKESALATAPPEQADQLVERWEQIAAHGEGTPATDNFYFRCAMERCAAELKATFRATPEQAALYHCTYCDGNHNEKDCPQCCVPDQPQAVSGGALNVEQVKSCFPATSTTQSDAEWWTICTGNLNAALAAHDQKVRREVLEEAAQLADKRVADGRGCAVTGFEIRSLKGETMNNLEAISAKVHEQWMENKRKSGVTTRKSESGEELMVPYEQLSEAAKELDRGSVRAVLAAQDALRSPAEP